MYRLWRDKVRGAHARCHGGKMMLVLLAGPLASLPALADISDTIHPFVAASMMYDDNLLRLPDNEVLDGSRSDTYWQYQAGLLFERPIGRQLWTGQATLSRVAFHHFSALDYTGKDYKTNLAWVLGNHLEGNAGLEYSDTLAPFSDFQTNERNLRVQRREYVDGAWRFHPSWRLHAAYSRTMYRYDLLDQRINDRNEDTRIAGMDYVASSGSLIGLQLYSADVHYLQRLDTGNGSDSYRDDALQLNVDWILSGLTRLRFVGGAGRRHAGDGDSRSTGNSGRLIADWTPTGKLAFQASAWREVAPVDNAAVTSSLNKGASISGTWAATAKISVQGEARREKRDFSALDDLSALTGLNDTSTTVSLGVSYAPLRNVLFSLRGFRDKRDSMLFNGAGGYTAKGIAFNGKVQF